MRLHYGKDHTRTGDIEYVAGPLVAPGTKTGVVFCHAFSHTTATMAAPYGGRPQAWSLMRSIASVYPTIVADQGGDNWGNDIGVTGVGGSVAYLQSSTCPIQAKAGKVLLVGVSMGFQVACAWALQNLSKVAGIAGILPLASVGDIYTRDWNGSKAAIDAAYPGTGWVQGTHGPTKDPTVFASSLSGIPIKLWYGGSDPGATPTAALAFAAAVGSSASTQNLGAISHDTEAAYPLALSAGLLEFLAAYA